MDKETWLAKRDEMVAFDRELSDGLMKRNMPHYTIRYSNVMGVRSDYIQWEEEQLKTGKMEQAVTYSLDEG